MTNIVKVIKAASVPKDDFGFAELRHYIHGSRFGSLILFDDTVFIPSGRFPMHPHKHLEIITYMLNGEISHEDSLGHKGLIKEGEFQYIRAGNGIYHTNINPDSSKISRLLQIWFAPAEKIAEPYFITQEKNMGLDKFNLLASSSGEEGSLKINANIKFYDATFEAGTTVDLPISAEYEGYWIYVVHGEISIAESQETATDADVIILQPQAGHSQSMRVIQNSKIIILAVNGR